MSERRVYYCHPKDFEPREDLFVVDVSIKHPQFQYLHPDLLEKDGSLFTNFYESTKLYQTVPRHVRKTYSGKIAWMHPAEEHGSPNEKYLNWRRKVRSAPVALHYPKENLLGHLTEDGTILTPLDARNALYIPAYTEIVRKSPIFESLKEINADMIIVDYLAPRRSDERHMDLFDETGIVLTPEHINLLLNDERDIGHGLLIGKMLTE